jgi:hypothetical protein
MLSTGPVFSYKSGIERAQNAALGVILVSVDPPPAKQKRHCVRRRGRGDVVRCRAREPYGGVACLWALEDQLLCGLLSRLLVVGQWPDGGGQQRAVRDVQHAVLGRQRRVEQPDRSHGAVQRAA